MIRSLTDMEVETTLISVSSSQDSLYKLQRVRTKNLLVWTEPETMLGVFQMVRSIFTMNYWFDSRHNAGCRRMCEIFFSKA